MSEKEMHEPESKVQSPLRQAVLMAAGLGTRLRPITDRHPKPMIEVGGRPILEWTLDALPREIDEVIIVVSYLKEQIVGHFGNEWHGRRIKYVEQKELKGTGHVVHVAAPLLGQRFMVLNGDDLYLPSDLTKLTCRPLSVLGLRVEDNGRFGLLAVSDDGCLQSATEDRPQGSGGIINIGAYVLDRRFLDYDLVPIKNGTEFGLPHTLAVMAKDHEVRVVVGEAWLPIGYPEDIATATAWLETHRGAYATAA